MQVYYFYQHISKKIIFISQHVEKDHLLLFQWLDYVRDDIENDTEQWQKEIIKNTQLQLNELHIKYLLDIDHPCDFDTSEDHYDFLIFRKLITPDDLIKNTDTISDSNKDYFDLATTPIGFILTRKIIISVREQGNKTIESYIQRFDEMLQRVPEEQNTSRKMPSSPIDLCFRVLNNMIDSCLDLRVPMTKRVVYWQHELLQGHRRFSKWQKLFQENIGLQQIENLCEEQIEILQELRDELTVNYHYLIEKQSQESQDLLIVRMNNLTSHIERIQNYTSRLSDSIQSAIDLRFNVISNQTNENMRLLAIITTVFAPLSLLTGMYGMNFEFMPGLKSPMGFWTMLMIMLLCTLLFLYYFYRHHLVGYSDKSIMQLLAKKNSRNNINLFGLLEHEPKEKIKNQ